MKFEWDEAKATTNALRVDFSDATTILTSGRLFREAIGCIHKFF